MNICNENLNEIVRRLGPITGFKNSAQGHSNRRVSHACRQLSLFVDRMLHENVNYMTWRSSYTNQSLQNYSYC